MAGYSLPDFHYQAPNLDVQAPPDALPYSEYEDYHSLELLRLNGIGLSDEAVVATLANSSGILQAAAAHTIGSRMLGAAVPALRHALSVPNELTVLEAAYALARLHDPEGKAALVASLDRPIPAYLSPLLAAGYLAQLGDPRGLPIIVHALGLESRAARMLACKQLFFFIPFQSEQDAHGTVIDAVTQFKRMLNDPDTDLRWQAIVELRKTRAPAFIALLPAE